MKHTLVTIVIPLFNEEKAIESLVSALLQLRFANTTLDVIFVDDGSTDTTVASIQKHAGSLSYTIISLSRNFGHQAALLAGLEAASGDYVVTMDGDLQHPPGLIAKMLEAHTHGIDIVLTQRLDGAETGMLKRQTSSLFYRLINSMSSQHIVESSSDFRSLNRRALDALLAMPEKRKFLRGMVQWIGFSQLVIPFETQKRSVGTSKYTWKKMLSLAGSGITSFSTAPLYLSAIVGTVLFVAAIAYALYVIYVRYFTGAAVEGWASVLFVLLIIGGSLSLFLGLIGIYVAAIYDEVKNRPNFIIANTITKKL